ncbi:hypothetical protein EWM64_g528 [Hericium alpestre]|uniref:Uncharacterized protein n=1 Tax=Hericium alpestre TaxID=135208 RepID=A0A4Z0AAW3_9AGAM|nr:hypothetical protein EWM64_g528 [Hericium alpestre]
MPKSTKGLSRFYHTLSRHARARNLKTKARLQHHAKKSVLAAKLSSATPLTCSPGVSTSAQPAFTIAQGIQFEMVASGSANTAESTHLASGSTPDTVSPPSTMGSYMHTPALSSGTAYSPALSDVSTPPPTPRTSKTSMTSFFAKYVESEVLDESETSGDIEGGLAAGCSKRRGFRGARLYATKKFSDTLSPLSPGSALRRVSSNLINRISHPSPSSPMAIDFEVCDDDPFALRGDPYYAQDGDESSYADIFSFSIYEQHLPEKGSRRISKQSNASSGLKPRVRTIKPRLNIYDMSMYDAGIKPSSPTRSCCIQVSPTTPAEREARNAGASTAAGKRKDMKMSLPLPITQPAVVPLTRSASQGARRPTTKKAPIGADTAAEGLTNRDYLRSVARARFEPDANLRSSVSSGFSERSHTAGLRPLILPQQVAARPNSVLSYLSEPCDESECRRAEETRGGVQNKRRSKQLDDIISLLDEGEERMSWNVDLENGFAVDRDFGEKRRSRALAV